MASTTPTVRTGSGAPCAPGLDEVPAAVDEVLARFFAAKAETGRDPARLPEGAAGLGDLIALLRDFTRGGKRLRPLLCCCGWHAAGGGDPAPVLPAAASLELFHTFALIHDDVMDRSETRRGRPTVHRTLAARARRLPHLDAERFGNSAAVLLGDLAMVWSDELLHSGGLPAERLAAARTVLDAMRSEVMYGQYLDLLGGSLSAAGGGQGAAAGGGREGARDGEEGARDGEEGARDGEEVAAGGLEAALTVVRYKTAKYTAERPLQLGAALAGGDRAVLAACSAYGVPLGEAFQLRDDLLGVFGEPGVTGKSRLDDLRDGKHTALLALALRRADPLQARALRALVGDPELSEEDAALVRGILRRTGAADTVERMIADRRARALRALDDAPFPPSARALLRRFATVVTVRAA
ncbi:polyprenyl synthetase family protein [Streptomyces sp. JJ36]|uniref:polyprenyl synthetase family protein n=1 Tax=Streptomyces sp. JJ36 TaxID=2736645 RepID=UPI001F4483F6|nr:polyprenyl synthetase family protein [Streptomyces sp. JJ36]MCF6525844.1 polyprenyl synthetase family protein [Streptomyces sp. JJ36]